MKYTFWLNLCVLTSAVINLSFVAPLPYHPKNKVKQLVYDKEVVFLLKSHDDNNVPKSSLRGRAVGLSNELINLKTILENDQVKFTWTAETNEVKRYILQSSSDLESYVDIAEIKGGKNNELLTYTHEIHSQEAAKFYRILAVKSDKNIQVYAPMAIYRPDFKGVTIHSDEQSDMIRVKQDDVDTAEILVSTASGMGVPCQVIVKSSSEAILWPSYELSNGEYSVRLRTTKGERKFRLLVAKPDKMF
ncbi:hypothetical protein [Cellulophaga sp. BC115SP]|uniref:hypothetical protein n=1 Tax=Cellulophaga sp. BC115SP TaxID=2683263 RepID=UPI001411C05D|nr:hypothetical protein [Cellulophaga sp. BC115SP]NBB27465.1 hypothetical protein [Cellulophaga sp. BC115SP]